MHSRSNGQFSVVTAGTVVANVFQLINNAGVNIAELGTLSAFGTFAGGPALAFRHLDGLTSDSQIAWTQTGAGSERLVIVGPRPVAVNNPPNLDISTTLSTNRIGLEAGDPSATISFVNAGVVARTDTTGGALLNIAASATGAGSASINLTAGKLPNSQVLSLTPTEVTLNNRPIVGIVSGLAAGRPATEADGFTYHETNSKRRTYQFHQASGNWRTLGDIDDTWNISTGAVSFGFSTLNITDQFQYRRIWGTTLEWECEFTLTGVPNPGLLIIVSPVPPATIGLNVGHPVGSAVLLDSGLSRRLGVVIADAAVPTWFSINDPAAGGLNLWNSATNNPITYDNVDGLVAAGRFRCLAG
jgi:hypothetical protein